MDREHLINAIQEKIDDIDSQLPSLRESFNRGWAEGRKSAYQDVLRWMEMQ
jgi:predicted phage tail protein